MSEQPPRPGPLGPGFRNVFVANLGSSLADGIARVAAPLLAVRLTDDPLLISGIAAVALLPWLFFAIPAGIVLDRIDRRRALAVANAVRTVLAVALFVLTATGSLTIWWLYAVIFVYGAFETLYDGAIRAVVPSLVERRSLPRANSRIEAGELVVQNFAAAPFTSALFAVSVLIPLGVGVLGYAVAGLLALWLPLAAAGEHHGTGGERERVPWRDEVRQGLRFILGNRTLRPLWFLSTVVALGHSAATATLVLYVLDRLGVPEAWFGAFMLSMAVGGLVGAWVASPAKERFGAGPVMAVASLASALAVVAIGVWPTVPGAAVGLAVSSGAVTAWNVLVMSLRQSIIPSRLLGRVHGTWRTLLWGVIPLGSVLGGLLARVDLVTPLLVGGGLAALTSLLGFRFLYSLPDPEDVEATP
ncbi:MFS transporter [Occultella glacieicola]|uniref:MFS transporter n=1 Tax=Occultella glacieicola TaxID=2518684 RepID=A0ABY2DZN8_9MICO|nr:MFS transporter [Occultella glacieicola]TDE90348.1 MFS transporter [Occultella glacieicola]